VLNINDIYKNESDYLRAKDLDSGKKYPMTIDRVGTVTFPARDNQPEVTKLSIEFQETGKKWACAKVCAIQMGDVMGEDAEQWIGKKVFLFKIPVPVGDKMMDAIRVELPMEVASFEQPSNLMSQQQQPQQVVQQPQQPSNFDNFDDDIPF